MRESVRELVDGVGWVLIAVAGFGWSWQVGVGAVGAALVVGVRGSR